MKIIGLLFKIALLSGLSVSFAHCLELPPVVERA